MVAVLDAQLHCHCTKGNCTESNDKYLMTDGRIMSQCTKFSPILHFSCLWFQFFGMLQINLLFVFAFSAYCLQCSLPSVLWCCWCCWLGSSKGIQPVKSEWWDANVVICLGQGADLHMVKQMSLPLTVSCSSKSRLVLPFWYWLTWVVLDKIQRAIKWL